MVLERNVKNKMADRITNDEGFQRAKEKRLRLKILKNRHILYGKQLGITSL
jgi:hypothetical protein